MSKRALKKYLNELKKEELEEQIMDLYGRFKEVKTFYTFVFNPKEDRMLEESKFKISKEYFPINGRKPKTRRSVAQKIIKHFIQLGVEPGIIADIMLFNIETAQSYAAEKFIKQDAFYVSMLKSFQEAVPFIVEQGLRRDFEARMERIVEETQRQEWMNEMAFEQTLIDYK